MLTRRPKLYSPASRLTATLGLLCGLLPAACGGDEAEGPPKVEVKPSSPDPRHNILVVDDGFDPTVPELRNNVAGLYSIVCPKRPAPAPKDEPDEEPPYDFAKVKADAIAWFERRDERCGLEEGVVPKANPLARIDHYRDRWNRMMRDSRFYNREFSEAEFKEIDDRMDKDLDGVDFHGTATAGTIAYNNPEARLVLVEMPLGNAGEAMASYKCFTAEDVQRTIALYGDPEVRDAYVAQPPSRLDDDLRELKARHRIGLVNESFGAFARKTLESLQRSKKCPEVDFRRYFAVFGEIHRLRAEALPQESSLVVKSAGNEAAQIDTAEDDFECVPETGEKLTVGAYDRDGKRATFSNYGKCVEAFAPGLRVLSPIPGAWLMPLAGTSFSAPLVVRLISMDVAAGAFTSTDAREAVLARLDRRQRVPLAQFPRDLFYDPENIFARYTFQVPVPPRQPEVPRVSALALRRTLEMLELGRGRGPH